MGQFVRILRAVFLVALPALTGTAWAQECPQCPCKCPETPAAEVSPSPVPAAAPAPVAAAPARSGQRVASAPIAGGSTAAQALPIDYERIYKINHPLKKGQKDYFSLPLEPGTELTLAMKSLKKSEAALQILDMRGETVATLGLDGEGNAVKRVSWKPLKTGRHTIVIGSDAADIEANQIIFEALLTAATLECADDDAGVLAADMAHEDCFWETNTKDTFRFAGERGDVYRIEIASPEEVTDLKAKVARERKGEEGEAVADVSGSGGRVTIESLTLPEDGNYVLDVGIDQAAVDVLPYTVTMTRLSGR
ncbi:MAG TPA: hypothetical protein VFX30_07070 [bacterium]|nr:hypothetical protein [bacterium]